MFYELPQFRTYKYLFKVFVVLSILFPPAAVFMLKDIGLHLVILFITTHCHIITLYPPSLLLLDQASMDSTILQTLSTATLSLLDQGNISIFGYAWKFEGKFLMICQTLYLRWFKLISIIVTISFICHVSMYHCTCRWSVSSWPSSAGFLVFSTRSTSASLKRMSYDWNVLEEEHNRL